MNKRIEGTGEKYEQEEAILTKILFSVFFGKILVKLEKHLQLFYASRSLEVIIVDMFEQLQKTWIANHFIVINEEF